MTEEELAATKLRHRRELATFHHELLEDNRKLREENKELRSRRTWRMDDFPWGHLNKSDTGGVEC